MVNAPENRPSVATEGDGQHAQNGNEAGEAVELIILELQRAQESANLINLLLTGNAPPDDDLQEAILQLPASQALNIQLSTLAKVVSSMNSAALTIANIKDGLEKAECPEQNELYQKHLDILTRALETSAWMKMTMIAELKQALAMHRKAQE